LQASILFCIAIHREAEVLRKAPLNIQAAQSNIFLRSAATAGRGDKYPNSEDNPHCAEVGLHRSANSCLDTSFPIGLQCGVLLRLDFQTGFEDSRGERGLPDEHPALCCAVATLLLSGVPSSYAQDTYYWYAGLGQAIRAFNSIRGFQFRRSPPAALEDRALNQKEFDAGFKGS